MDAIEWIIIIAVIVLIAYLKGRSSGSYHKKEERADAIKDSKSVIRGQVAEQFAPYMPGFPFKPTECKFLGKPNDFIVYEGMDEKNITSIVFVEVKTGNSKRNDVESSLKYAIERGNVSYYEYRM